MLTAACAAVIGGLAGLIVGSFAATLVVRWPQGRGVVAGRSQCDGCGVALAPLELVPVLSFAIRRGRCARCGARIDPIHLRVELAAGAIGLAAALAAPGWAGVAGAVLGWLLLPLAILDARLFWLPDRLTLPLALAGLAGGLAGLDPPLRDRLAGGVGGFVLLAAIGLLYRAARGREGLGGGDPKLLGALGLWLGWRALPFVLLGASVAGLGWVGWRMARGERVDAATRIPLGTPLAIAGWGMWLATALGVAP